MSRSQLYWQGKCLGGKEWGRTRYILHRLRAKLDKLENVDGKVVLKTSRNKVPYLRFCIVSGWNSVWCNVSWFGGNEERPWRGLKLFFYRTHVPDVKVKFAAMDYDDFKVYEEGDPDPRLKIIEAVDNLTSYVESYSFDCARLK